MHAFLDSLPGPELDKTVELYIVDVVTTSSENGVVDESAPEDLDSILAGMHPGFGGLDEAERLPKLLHLLEQAAELQSAQTHPTPAVTMRTGSANLANSVTSASGIGIGPTRAASGAGTSTSGTISDGVCDAQPAVADHAGVQQLLGLCDGAVTADFLAHLLLQQCLGDVEAAATWLLEQPDLQESQAQWQERQAQQAQMAQEARMLKERNKQVILSRFDLQAVAVAKDPKKGKPQEQLQAWSGQGECGSKVRYLDGRIVSNRGEKFIIEKQGEEWDGGSRGKVYTKGKRGKGFA